MSGHDHETASGYTKSSVLVNRYLTKGTAFTNEEREQLGILGRLPFTVETLDEQVARAYAQFKSYEHPINRYQYLTQLQSANTTLFYAVVSRYGNETLPVIYTPTVGEACQKFAHVYARERGFYVTSSLKGRYTEMLKTAHYDDTEIIVITDGSRILGLGDLGTNGMGISLGKCSLYIVGGGIRPRRALPVCYDSGTNNTEIRDDPQYLGQRIPRVSDEEFYAGLDEFMEAVKVAYPRAVVQFEDFSNNHCFDMLDRYQLKYRCFNDDIQGTGAVVSAGFMNAITASELDGLHQRIVVLGAGSAAVGVCKNIAKLVAKLKGTSEDDTNKLFYLVDTKGLVSANRGDKLASHKVALARQDIDDETAKNTKSLLDVFKLVKPTAFLGLAGDGPVLTQEMVNIMNEQAKHPIIFPLSNPSSKAEILPENAYKWTNGNAIVASGSPFGPTEVNGKTLKPSQGNNMYVFPGIGLGAILAQPDHISDELMVEASACLYSMPSDEDRAQGALYPDLSKIRSISQKIATAVIKKCQADGTAKNPELPKDEEALFNWVGEQQWKTEYGPPGQPNSTY